MRTGGSSILAASRLRTVNDIDMLRFVTLYAIAVALSSAAPKPDSRNVFAINISPEEAAKFLNSPPFTEPQLSGRTAVLPLVRYNDPRFRTAEAGPTLGHYWKNGREIQNTDDYVEEVYDATQYHGQDGLGAYGYGYKTPQSSKVEHRDRSGDVTGSYTYQGGPDGLIKVRYWADSQGFHQVDNLPKPEGTYVVRQTRQAHEKAWQEAAGATAQNPDPQGAYNPSYDYNQAASEQRNVVAGKAFAQTLRNFQSNQYSQQQQYQPQQQEYGQQQYQQQYEPTTGQASEAFAQTLRNFQSNQYRQQQQYQQQPQEYGQQQYQQQYEPTGGPRGFFYSFNYPVSVIAPRSGQQSGAFNPGQPLDHDTVGVSA